MPETRITIPEISSELTEPIAADLLVIRNSDTGSDKKVKLGNLTKGLGYTPSGTGAFETTVQEKLRRYVDVKDNNILVSNTAAANTVAFQALLDSHLFVEIRDAGDYLLSDKLTLRDNHHIRVCAGTNLIQTAADKQIFYALNKRGIVIEFAGGTLEGQGAWSASWTGNGGHFDKAIHFISCNDFTIYRPKIINCASAGIAIEGGGAGSLIDTPLIEGTNTHGVPLPYEANFQSGIYLNNSPVYGTINGLEIRSPDISGVAQGVLHEAQTGATLPVEGIRIVTPNIHDITGQHAFYLQCGQTKVISPTCTDIALSGYKLQIGDAGADIEGSMCTNMTARNLGSQMFEIINVHPTLSGAIKQTVISGTGTNIGRAIALGSRVERLQADVLCSSVTDSAVQIGGEQLLDVDIKISSRNSARDGVYIFATDSSGIRIYPKIQNPNTSAAGTPCGIRVQSPSCEVELFDPEVIDDNNRMAYGLFNSVLGGDVKVRGSATFVGALDTAVRATGKITEWPTEAVLQGAGGDWIGLNNVSSSQAMITSAISTSGSNVIVWQQTLDDESSYLIKCEITAKLQSSAERRAVVVSGLFYRDAAGIAVLQGAVNVSMDVASAGFTGGYSLQSTGGNEVALLANSGAATNYTWKSRTTVTKIS